MSTKKKQAVKPTKKRSHHKKKVHEPVLAVHVAPRAMEPITASPTASSFSQTQPGHPNWITTAFEPGDGYAPPLSRIDPPLESGYGGYAKLPDPAPLPETIPVPSLGNWFDHWADKYQPLISDMWLWVVFAAIVLFTVVYVIIRGFSGISQG